MRLSQLDETDLQVIHCGQHHVKTNPSSPRVGSGRLSPWVILAVCLVQAFFAQANPPRDGANAIPFSDARRLAKEIDSPNPVDRARILRRLAAQQGTKAKRIATTNEPVRGEGPELLGLSGTDRVLVILVEFAGTNTFTWTPGVSTWDPLGRCDNAEFDGSNLANGAASQFFANKYQIGSAANFTYRGPLHNEIPRPFAAKDPSGSMVWMPDFAPAYYSNIIFGSGIIFDFVRQDGSIVHEDFTGKSVRDYYADLSAGAYSITGEVLGWVKVTNSVWYYGADGLPGARSCSLRPANQGAIAGAGDARSLVIDALKSARAAYPSFDWASYDQDGDGFIDRLWIIHAGLGEEDNPGLLYRTSYGEGGMWSHSWSLASPYQVVPGVSAYSYIMMPENAGIAVLAHEFGHNLGAIDLYTYGDGQTSVGFWSLMADSWTGFPLGFLPEAMDPMHLDQWGWLSPLVVSDPTKVYTARLGQASYFPSAADLERAVKIELPNAVAQLAVQPHGQYQWWGGNTDLAEARMTLKQSLHVPAAGATLEYQTAYDIEAGYDFFYVEASTNGGVTWRTLTQYSGMSTGYPNYQSQSLSLAGFVNRDVLLRFRYTTDSYYVGEGPFVDDIVVRSGTNVLFSDDAEMDTGLWNYTLPCTRNNGFAPSGFTHSYYLQWRNTGTSGGYDQAIGDARFRFGPANTGLLVWYENDHYSDNSIADYLIDPPSFGPKGKLLLVDSHPQPYLDPYWLAHGISNELGIVFSRGAMRDAPFGRWPSRSFELEPPFAYQAVDFPGLPAMSQFSDSAVYYPGIQQIATNLWRTWQWDASVVLPSTVSYGTLGPGYSAGTPLQTIIATRAFIGTNEVITYRTNLFSTGLNRDGADGTPGSVKGEYGWNVRVLYQTDAWGEVVIWNSHYADLDDDGDGVPNWQEVIAGTDPKNRQSYLRITRAAFSDADGSLLLEWPSSTNRTYRVERADSLSAVFQSIAAGLVATPPTNVFRDTNSPPHSAAYYRIEVE